MECLSCGNCKDGSVAYFCPMRNDFVVHDEETSKVKEKNRTGWKKGQPNYEVQRRKNRKEVEV